MVWFASGKLAFTLAQLFFSVFANLTTLCYILPFSHYQSQNVHSLWPALQACLADMRRKRCMPRYPVLCHVTHFSFYRSPETPL